MLGQAVAQVKAHPGTSAEKADMFDRLAKYQSEPLSKGSWKATRATGADGSHVFVGKAGEALIISPDARLYRGSFQSGSLRVATPRQFIVQYEKLRLI
jgi:hypothetical protein